MNAVDVVAILILVLNMVGTDVLLTLTQSNIPFSKSMHNWFSRQGFGVQGARSISQVAPVRFAVHRQEKSFISSTQLPLFKHGFGTQSSISTKQSLPV